MNTRSAIRLAIAGMVLIAIFVLRVTSSSADVYCVDATPGTLTDNQLVDPSCHVAAESIKVAVGSAEASAEPDTVLIGPGDYTLPAGVGPNYREIAYEGIGGNTLQVKGSGTGTTHLTMGSTVEHQTGLYVSAPQGSSLGDFELTIPKNVAPASDFAIQLSGSVAARRLRIDGPSATNGWGLRMGYGSYLLDHVAIDFPQKVLPSDLGLWAGGSELTIVDSTIHAMYGMTSSEANSTIERSTFETAEGITLDSGSVTVRDSQFELGDYEFAAAVNAVNFNSGIDPITATLEGTTIVGGGPESAGIYAQADNGTEATTVTLADSIIEGPQRPFQLFADNGRTARLVASYSNFDASAAQIVPNRDGAGASGSAIYEPTSVTHLAPGFVNPSAGDLHLSPSSPLVDAGDPAAPPAGETDIDGDPRAARGACPAGAGRRDIGADEAIPRCVAPDTTIHARRRVATRRKRARVRVTLGSSEPGAAFSCSVDGRPFHPCAADFSLRLKRGRHTVRAEAVGVGGSDQTPAVARVRVVHRKRHHGGGKR